MSLVAAADAGRNWLGWTTGLTGLVAFVTGTITFIKWSLNLRRRPEVRYRWQFSPTGEIEDLREWSPTDQQVVNPGEEFLVLVAIQNLGDATGETTLTNFVAPDVFELRRSDDPQQDPLTSRNEAVGFTPDKRVVFFAAERRWYPTMWWMHIFRLKLKRDPSSERLRLMLEVSDDRLNATGSRWCPSYTFSENSSPPDLSSEWPGSKLRRMLRWIEAKPRKHVRCSLGVRQDVRELSIRP